MDAANSLAGIVSELKLAAVLDDTAALEEELQRGSIAARERYRTHDTSTGVIPNTVAQDVQSNG